MSSPKILTDLPGKVYVIGDIHGCSDELNCLLKSLEPNLLADDTVIFLGDYIDRGPDTKGVVSSLITFKSMHPRTIFLRGNHEDMLLGYINGHPRTSKLFLPNAATTLLSYGINNPTPDSVRSILPPDHIEFYESLESYVVSQHHVFVHAGLHPLVDLLMQQESALFWIRDEFIQNIHRFDKLVIFGHTPYQDVMVHAPFKVGIDTGLVYGNKLTCLELRSKIAYQVAKGRTVVTSQAIVALPDFATV